jgi:two-component system sensor histidine kinase RpfC
VVVRNVPTELAPMIRSDPIQAVATALRTRFAARPDTEHEQSLVRLVMTTIMTVILLLVAPDVLLAPGTGAWLKFAIVTELVAAVVLVIAVALSTRVSHTRRILGMAVDYFTSGIAMVVVGIEAAPLWGLYLWITIGNGLRFGPRYLVLSIAMSMAGFGLILLAAPSWRAYPVLAMTLFGVLLVIPAYLYSLVKALTAARDEAARANQAKSWFLASMSHELRTPLNGLLTAIELLGATRLSAEQRDLSETATASGKALLHLVNDILDISAIEAGRLGLSEEPADPRSLLDAVRAMLAPSAAARRIELKLTVAPDVPALVLLDTNRAQQALMNLAHNAVKFTEQGYVALSLGTVHERDKSWLLFEVRDTGIGIPREAVGRIFRAFEQADRGTARKFGGTGLGTTITKSLVEKMGGSVGVESQMGKGSRFWFRLPLREVAVGGAATVPRAARPSLDDAVRAHVFAVGHRRVLILDDLASNRVVLKLLLERFGHTVLEYESPHQALEAIIDRDVDVAVIDWHMPEVTGLDFLRELRTAEGGSAHTPVIILTADATQQARDSALSAGAQAFLTKPISPSLLMQSIEAALHVERASYASATVTSEHNGSANEQISVLDITVWEELVDAGLSKEVVRNLAKAALDDAARNLNLAVGAAGREDWDALRDHCHALKGVASNAGARQLAGLANLGMRMEPGQRPTRWPDIAAQLHAALERARAAVSEQS